MPWMPLFDHFHPPLSQRRHWQNIHSAWANALRDQLNDGLLPPRFFAEVQIAVGTQLEIDVATYEEGNGEADAESGGVAVWAPPRPPQTAILPAAPPEVFEVRVYNEEEGPRLMAAAELVSPANKDRPASRHVFSVKCASYLFQGIHLVVADVVNLRPANLHHDLFRLLKLAKGKAKPRRPELYAAAYRACPGSTDRRLEYCLEPLSIGKSLPTLPLWIGPDQAVPLDLEQAYRKACKSSRIR
jgi:hypothetical protein